MPSPLKLVRVVSTIAQRNEQLSTSTMLVECPLDETKENLEEACAWVLARREDTIEAATSYRFNEPSVEDRNAILARAPDFVDETHRFWFV